jgi:hypothetical protein
VDPLDIQSGCGLGSRAQAPLLDQHFIDGLDGEALIAPSKNYLLKLDFGNKRWGGRQWGCFRHGRDERKLVSTSRARGILFGENAALAGYDKLVNDFYYNGNPGTLTFDGLTIGQILRSGSLHQGRTLGGAAAGRHV